MNSLAKTNYNQMFADSSLGKVFLLTFQYQSKTPTTTTVLICGNDRLGHMAYVVESNDGMSFEHEVFALSGMDTDYLESVELLGDAKEVLFK